MEKESQEPSIDRKLIKSEESWTKNVKKNMQKYCICCSLHNLF